MQDPVPAGSPVPDDPDLDDIRARHPQWDIRRGYANYVAIPKGTPRVGAMTVDSLEDKLTRLERQGDQ
jgi:hypothetical protein